MNSYEKYQSLKDSFENTQDIHNALKMSGYMRDLFKFYGIAAPKRKAVYKKDCRFCYGGPVLNKMCIRDSSNSVRFLSASQGVDSPSWNHSQRLRDHSA